MDAAQLPIAEQKNYKNVVQCCLIKTTNSTASFQEFFEFGHIHEERFYRMFFVRVPTL